MVLGNKNTTQNGSVYNIDKVTNKLRNVYFLHD